MLWGVLLPRGLIHRSQSRLLKFILEFQPAQYSSPEAAAMAKPSASPGTSPLLLSKCSQVQHGKTISSTASGERKKPPLRSKGLLKSGIGFLFLMACQIFFSEYFPKFGNPCMFLAISCKYLSGSSRSSSLQ